MPDTTQELPSDLDLLADVNDLIRKQENERGDMMYRGRADQALYNLRQRLSELIEEAPVYETILCPYCVDHDQPLADLCMVCGGVAEITGTVEDNEMTRSAARIYKNLLYEHYRKES